MNVFFTVALWFLVAGLAVDDVMMRRGARRRARELDELTERSKRLLDAGQTALVDLRASIPDWKADDGS